MGGAGDTILIKKKKTKIVRTYDRTDVHEFEPKWIQKRKNKKKNSTYEKNKKR